MAQIRIPHVLQAVLSHMASTLGIDEDELLSEFTTYIEDVASEKVERHESDNIHEINRYY